MKNDKVSETVAETKPAIRERGGFTPGPWEVGSRRGKEIYNPCNVGSTTDEQYICSVYGIPLHVRLSEIIDDERSAEGLANAHLIAAAPDLLAALKEVVSLSDRKTHVWDRAHAAIARAEGRDAETISPVSVSDA